MYILLWHSKLYNRARIYTLANAQVKQMDIISHHIQQQTICWSNKETKKLIKKIHGLSLRLFIETLARAD